VTLPQRVQSEIQVLQVLQDKLVQQAQLVTQVLKEIQVHKVRLAQLEIQVLQVKLEQSVKQEQQV
jgi:hypothetical protein